MRWPLLTLAAGLLVWQLGGWLGARVTSEWRRAQPKAIEERLAFVRNNPFAWLLPVLAFGGIGLVLGGLVWLLLLALS